MELAEGVQYLRPFRGFACFVPVYEYKGWRFEYKPQTGAWPLRKDSDEPFKRVGTKSKFWDMLDDFLSLPDDQQRQYRISGGCILI